MPDTKQSPSFARLGLPAVLVQALNRARITDPSPIQLTAIPDALMGKDVLGRAPTGSGKTLAFGLPMLVRLSGASSTRGRPRGLVLVPTRELAAQVEAALDAPAAAMGLRVASVVGGVPMKRQADVLARGVDVLVATPGRLADHLAQKTASLADVSITVLDEADQLADMGFLAQVTTLLDLTQARGQRMLFSATLDGEVDALVTCYLSNPVVHATAPVQASVTTMTHHLLHVDSADKKAVVAEIGSRAGRTIMFVRTKHGVDRLAMQLHNAGINAGALHGGKAQNIRTRTLDAFKDGDTPVLVATDVAARGIHVDGVSLVVHVDPPTDPKAYLHRAGRTARVGELGVVVTLVTPDERIDVERMARSAGVSVEAVHVQPGSLELTRITGAQEAPGVPRNPPGSVSAAHSVTPVKARTGSGTRRQETGGPRGNNRRVNTRAGSRAHSSSRRSQGR